MLPARLDEPKKSAARSGAPTALIQAKARIPDLKPADIGQGYLDVKEGGLEFNNDDLRGNVTHSEQIGGRNGSLSLSSGL